MAKRILVAVDRTTPPEELLAFVSDAARGGGATVRLLHVAPMPDSIVTDGRTLAYSDQEEARHPRGSAGRAAHVGAARRGG